MAGKMLVKDWNLKYVGKEVLTSLPTTRSFKVGTLCGYTGDGDGAIVCLMVAFAPDDRREYAVADVELT